MPILWASGAMLLVKTLKGYIMGNNTKTAAVETTINGTVLTLTFANGETLVVDSANLSAAIIVYATLHGLKQKLCDAAAISRDPATGKTATIETKYEAVREVFDRITSPDGTWNKPREVRVAAGGLLLCALVRMYQGRRTKAELAEFLENRTDTEKAALRKNKVVAGHIEDIRREREATDGEDSIDSDELLAVLNDRE